MCTWSSLDCVKSTILPVSKQNYLRVQQVTGAATYDVVKVVGEYFCLMESHVTSLSFVVSPNLKLVSFL